MFRHRRSLTFDNACQAEFRWISVSVTLKVGWNTVELPLECRWNAVILPLYAGQRMHLTRLARRSFEAWLNWWAWLHVCGRTASPSPRRPPDHFGIW